MDCVESFSGKAASLITKLPFCIKCLLLYFGQVGILQQPYICRLMLYNIESWGISLVCQAGILGINVFLSHLRHLYPYQLEYHHIQACCLHVEYRKIESNGQESAMTYLGLPIDLLSFDTCHCTFWSILTLHFLYFSVLSPKHFLPAKYLYHLSLVM